MQIDEINERLSFPLEKLARSGSRSSTASFSKFDT